MNCYTLASNLGLTLRVVAGMEEGRLPSPMAREYLQAGAWAIMQMWRDLEEQEVVLRDLARIQAQHKSELHAAVKSAAQPSPEKIARKRPAKTASHRRTQVEKLLASEEAGSLTLRQIAQRVGVSPATVLNIKRRLEARSN